MIDVSRFYPEDQKKAKKALKLGSPPTINIGYIPSFDSTVKGQAQFQRAMFDLEAVHPNIAVNVVVAGTANLNIGDVPFPVRAVGKLSSDKALRTFYSAIDVLVVPSLEETFSNTVIESLACGTPVVGFQTGVLQELLIDPAVGLAVPVGDTQALARAVVEVSKTRRSPEELHNLVAKRYSGESRIAQYMEAFESLASKHNQYDLSDAEQSQDSELKVLRDRRRAVALRKKVLALRSTQQAGPRTNINKEVRPKIRHLPREVLRKFRRTYSSEYASQALEKVRKILNLNPT
jgi:hypothetical protein